MVLQIFFSVKYFPTNTTGITIFIVCLYKLNLKHSPANIARVFTLFPSVNFLVILQYSRRLERFITNISFMSKFFVFTLHVSIKAYFHTKFLSTFLTFNDLVALKCLLLCLCRFTLLKNTILLYEQLNGPLSKWRPSCCDPEVLFLKNRPQMEHKKPCNIEN